MSTQKEAIALCCAIEEIAPEFGAHVALTGGCLYKIKPGVRGPQQRKDIDILFYRVRQLPEINETGLLNALVERLGFILGERYGWGTEGNTGWHEIGSFLP